MELKWAVDAMIGILLVILCIGLAAVLRKRLSSLDWTFESASKRAGRDGLHPHTHITPSLSITSRMQKLLPAAVTSEKSVKFLAFCL